MDRNELVCLMTAILMASGRYDKSEGPLRAAYAVADGIYRWVYYPQPIKKKTRGSSE